MAAGGNLNISGNMSNNGTFNAGTGTVTFNGTANQTLTGITTFNALTINNNGAVNGVSNLILLNNPITVNALTLTKGIIKADPCAYTATPSPTNYITIPAGGSSSSGSANSFVWGFIKKEGNTNFKFPTGAVSATNVPKWAPIEIGTLSASDAFMAQYILGGTPNNWQPENMAGTIDNVSGLENWSLSRTGSATAFVTLYWTSATWSNINDPTNIVVTHYNSTSSVWEDMGAVYTDDLGGAGHVTTTSAMTSFSPFTFAGKKGSNNPLPIQLSEFKGLCKGDSRELLWKTASETNNDYFTIESSKNGLDWNFVAKVPGSGNSNMEKSYSFSDLTSESVLYYRLTQTDFNGQFKTFDPIVVNCADIKDKSISIFPNPFQSLISVSLLNISDENITVNIYDMFGKLIEKSTYRISNGFNNMITLDMGDLPAGVYYLEVKATNYVKSTKVVKNK
jgi:hypothetical protein